MEDISNMADRNLLSSHITTVSPPRNPVVLVCILQFENCWVVLCIRFHRLLNFLQIITFNQLGSFTLTTLTAKYSLSLHENVPTPSTILNILMVSYQLDSLMRLSDELKGYQKNNNNNSRPTLHNVLRKVGWRESAFYWHTQIIL